MLDDDFVADLLGFANDYHVVGTFDRRFFGISLRHDPVILQEIMAAESSLPDLMASPEHFLAQLTFEHEMTHWHQQIGTGYGYLQLEAEDCAARSVRSFFESYRRLLPRSPYPRPLAPWALDRLQRRKSTFRRHIQSGGDLSSYLGSISVDPCSNVLSAIILNRVVELCEGDAASDLLVAHFLYTQLWRALFANQESRNDEIERELSLLSEEESYQKLEPSRR